MPTPTVNPFAPLPGFTKEGIDGPSRGWELNVAAGLTLALAIVAVVLRIITKKCAIGSTNFEDYLAVAGLGLAIARSGIDFWLVQHHQLGYHVWDTLIPNFNSIYVYGKVTLLLYLAGIACIKCSVLMAYIRLFGVYTWFRWACYGFIVICIGYSLGLGIALIFQCQPISAGWHYFEPGKCVSLIRMNNVNGALNIFTDLAVVVLPMPLIWKMQLRFAKFLVLLAVFGSGLFVVVVSIVREVETVKGPYAYDATWLQEEREMWLCVEMNVGVFVACLPSLSPLLKNLPGMEFIKKKRHSVSPLQPGSRASRFADNQNIPNMLDNSLELMESGNMISKGSAESETSKEEEVKI